MDLSNTQRKIIAVAVAGSLHLAVAVPLTQLRIPPPEPVPVMISVLPIKSMASPPIAPAAPILAAPQPTVILSPTLARPVPPAIAAETPPLLAPVSHAETSAVAAPQAIAAVTPTVPASAVAASATVVQTLVAQASAGPDSHAMPAVERIEPPGFQAAYLDNPQPPYPLLSRRNREAGQVRLRVLVNADGRAETLKIQVSSGYPRLDMAASEAVRGWRFTPARQAGRNIAGWVEVPITFSLEN
jgi:protein TonB